MNRFRLKHLSIPLLCLPLLAGCGVFKNKDDKVAEPGGFENSTLLRKRGTSAAQGQSLFDAFRNRGSAEIKVNRFLWTAALDVLDFLPVQAADPFTGVITTGFGQPPGGGTQYRATVLISDPALDARSLNVALQTRRGPVSAETQRAVEDAILARARQLRINAGKF